jgi:hypothetical protein
MKLPNRYEIALSLGLSFALVFGFHYYADHHQSQHTTEQDQQSKAAAALAAQKEESFGTVARRLNTTASAKTVVSVVHFGTAYRGHRCLREDDVPGKPEDFALVIRYFWSDDGQTDLSFLCHKDGSIYDVQVVASNAVISQPFSVAQASLKMVGQALLEPTAATPEQKARGQQILAAADAKTLLLAALN